MHFWIDLNARPTTEQQLLRGTPSYLECQTHNVDPPGISYIYVTPLDNASFVVSACWGRDFDRFTQYIFDRKMGLDWVDAYGEAWPTFRELLRNATDGRYGAGSLVNFEDPDDGERKWHVATFVGNTSPKERYEELGEDPRIVEASQMVYIESAKLLDEIASGRDISGTTKAKLLAKGAWAGYQQGVDSSLVWLDRISKLAHIGS